jgi:hypothetical protein
MLGVEPVTDDQRAGAADPTDGGVQQWSFGLAGDPRVQAGGGDQRGDHRTVARQHAAVGRQGGVDVAGDPVRPGTQRDTTLGQVAPAGVRRMTLDHRDRVVLGQPDRLQPGLPHRLL